MNPAINEDLKACPVCKTSWVGTMIPLDSRKYYSPNSTHFSRLIGVEVQGKGDRVNHWQCPDCKSEFARES